MAHTIKDRNGNTSTPTVSGTSSGTAYGPPESGCLHYRGVYVNESGSGTARTMRWLRDEFMGDQDTSPTTYSFSPEHRG